MASRILNRRVLRESVNQAEQLEEDLVDAARAGAPAKKRAKTKASAVPKVKKARAKKASPRIRARWGVFDGSMKQVAIFDYSERAAAEEMRRRNVQCERIIIRDSVAHCSILYRIYLF